jgi:hypothetical protein
MTLSRAGIVARRPGDLGVHGSDGRRDFGLLPCGRAVSRNGELGVVGLRQLRLEVLVRRGAGSVVDAERVQGRRRSRVYVTEAG